MFHLAIQDATGELASEVLLLRDALLWHDKESWREAATEGHLKSIIIAVFSSFLVRFS
ncbi:hypothetical protein [Ekhidna sp.]|uniref:hypothetical protein n=1 Tax=Ekhidna sp. TaxID=2608089 RepID=UPI003C7CEDC8